MSEKQSGYIKPIIIGVMTTVVAGLILSYLQGSGSGDSGDPGGRPAQHTAEMGATLEKLTIERAVTLRDYLLRNPIENSQPKEEELAMTGVSILFETEIRGLTQRACPLYWSLYDANTNSKVALESHVNQLGPSFKPEAEIDRAGYELWIPNPPYIKPFFVRLELYDDKGVKLTFADTEVFEF